eukprot:sb/3475299/
MYLIRIKYVLTGPCPTTTLPRIATVFLRLLKQVPSRGQSSSATNNELLLSSPPSKTGPCSNTTLPRIATVFPALQNRSLSQYSSAKNCYCPCPSKALPRLATVFLRLLKQVPIPVHLCHELLLCSSVF